jgi:hypothetical protein
MKQFNFTQVVVLTIFFAITQMGIMREPEAHAGNASTGVIHACMAIKSGVVRIVPATGKCKKKESVLHWAIAGATGPAGPVGLQGPSGAAAPVGPSYKIGDVGPSGIGNIVAYVDGSGEHGLEVKAANEPSLLNWAAANTAAEAYNSPSCPTPALRTPSCWHLSKKTELELLYEANLVAGGFAGANYWSSTENGSGTAWYQGFLFGSQNFLNKDSMLEVRAVRAF